jgi:hypothetical protein
VGRKTVFGFGGKCNNILTGLEKSHSNHICIRDPTDKLFIVLEDVVL